MLAASCPSHRAFRSAPTPGGGLIQELRQPGARPRDLWQAAPECPVRQSRRLSRRRGSRSPPATGTTRRRCLADGAARTCARAVFGHPWPRVPDTAPVPFRSSHSPPRTRSTDPAAATTTHRGQTPCRHSAPEMIMPRREVTVCCSTPPHPVTAGQEAVPGLGIHDSPEPPATPDQRKRVRHRGITAGKLSYTWAQLGSNQ
jgi:hypothetical protein